MGMIFGRSEYAEQDTGGASWSSSSKKDPRFNMSGRCAASIWTMHSEAMDAVAAKAKSLGVPVPDDVEVSGCKD